MWLQTSGRTSASSASAVAPLLLLTLLLLLAARSSSEPVSQQASTQTLGSVRSIYREPDAAQALVCRPPFLGQQDYTSDNPANKKQYTPGGRPQQPPAAANAASAPPSAAAASPIRSRFIVQLRAPSAASAVGPTLQPTASAEDAETNPAGAGVARGIRVSRITPQAAAASAAVASQAQAVAASAGVTAQVSHKYSYALSGFAVEHPTAAQLQALASDPNVLSVTEDYRVYTTTYTTPGFLGLASTYVEDPRVPGKLRLKKRGVWDQLGGAVGSQGAGENVIIGVIDTGAWMPNHTCFADSNYSSGAPGSNSPPSYGPASGFHGVCSATEGQPECNNKVVGCRFYTAGWGGDSVISSIYPYEYLSCRDVDGHGSHTSSTAAGNYGGVSAAAPINSTMSGMAPRARLAIYKALWGRDGAGMATDIIAAIEDAIKDGVDVINYSASTSSDSFREAIVAAFMNAARAGIFVAAAAGNSGGTSTVNSISPWVTTVAASTHDRTLESALNMGNGVQLVGRGTRPDALGPLPLVYAANLPGTDNVTLAALCAPSSLNASMIAGPVILVCDRGEVLIKDKLAEARRIGAPAMVLLNVPGGKADQFQLEFDVAMVHLKSEQRDAVLQYVRSAQPNATASVGGATIKLGSTAPTMADFSSRGPISLANAAIMKPDVTAPGVDIYAAYTGSLQTLYSGLQGTSMATPHVAGIAGLIKDRYPHWSPMAIKSALMTTAYQVTRTGVVGQPFGTPLDHGAGHVDAGPALRPGFVFDSNYTDWQRLLCDVEPFPGDDCASLCPGEFPDSSSAATPRRQRQQQRPPVAGSKDVPTRLCNAYDFNGPWIAGDIGSSITVSRTLTSALMARDGRVFFSARSIVGANSSFDITVSPVSFRMRHNETQRVSITVSARQDTPLNQYLFGQVVWRSARGHVVKIPVAVRFADFVVPEYVRPVLRTTSFQYRYKVGASSATTVNITNLGITAAQVTPVVVQRTVSTNLDTPEVGKLKITIPEGNTYSMVGIFATEVSPRADLDLHLYQGSTLIGKSTSDSSTELVEAVNGLPAGEYTAYIYPYSLPTEYVTAYVHVWQLPVDTADATMQVSPSLVSVVPGDMGCCPITVSFSGLDFSAAPAQRYVGVLANSRGDGKAVSVPRTRVYLF